MALNRLRLDFSLETTTERLKFLDSYLPTLTFTPNEHETETLSDYILWGKNSAGLNSQQEGTITLKEWAPNTNVESLEGLLEIPGFSEARLQHMGDTHYKQKRIVFNREDILSKANPEMQLIFENLFEEIDRTELIINYYDIAHGKRKNEPRESLINRFTVEEQILLQKRAAALSPRKYLQMRHYLVELRTEQYTYRDSVYNCIMPHMEVSINTNIDHFQLEEDLEIFPFGLNNNSVIN